LNSNSSIDKCPQDPCPVTVHETVCVQGTVTITPNIEVGIPQSFCVGNPTIGGCVGPLEPSCSFAIGQQICVQIPLIFSATASAVENGLVCGDPATGGCPVSSSQ
jgi:hypothetical protein